MSDRPVCDKCGGWGIVRKIYKTISWYETRSKNDGRFYYMWAWRDKPCPKCQTRGGK